MNISKIIKECLEVAKGNPLIFIPMLASSIFSGLLSLVIVGTSAATIMQVDSEQIAANPRQALAGAGAMAGGVMIVGIIGGLVGLIAHGMSVGMADSALKGQTPTLKEGWTRLVSRIVPLIIAVILTSIMVGIGTILLVLPGLVLAFFLMFTFIAIMVDKLDAIKGISQSFKTVANNFGATFILFLVMIGMAIIAIIANFIVLLVPVIGPVLSWAVIAAFSGFLTIFMVRAYMELNAQADTTPDIET